MISFDAEEQGQIEHLLDAMLREYRERSVSWQTALKSYMNILFIRMLRKTTVDSIGRMARAFGATCRNTSTKISVRSSRFRIWRENAFIIPPISAVCSRSASECRSPNTLRGASSIARCICGGMRKSYRCHRSRSVRAFRLQVRSIAPPCGSRDVDSPSLESRQPIRKNRTRE